MIMNDKGGYSFEPKIGTVQKAGARTLFVINGLAKGTYRTAWKDSDTAKNIIGFINIECENPSNEEEFVWFFLDRLVDMALTSSFLSRIRICFPGILICLCNLCGSKCGGIFPTPVLRQGCATDRIAPSFSKFNS